MLSKKGFIIILGDLVMFFLSLWGALFIRFQRVPDTALLEAHLIPFIILFASWIVVFYIAGLYDKRVALTEQKLGGLIMNTQIVNSVIGISFFYLIPYFGITPKTILFIQLGLSVVLVLLWRTRGVALLRLGMRERAILVGTKEEFDILSEEVNRNPRYAMEFVSFVSPDDGSEIAFRDRFLSERKSRKASVVALDLRNATVSPILPELYGLMFSHVRFISVQKLHEEVFDRIPLTLLDHNWILENISLAPRQTYDILKRLMDIFVALLLLFPSLLLFPLVALAIKLDDGGPVFIAQERVGKGLRIVRIWKLRSMKESDGGRWLSEKDERVTRVGKFLRKSRLDELPQLWSVLRGDLSLIGPRPDILSLGKQLEGQISYYNIRSVITPGLSGWAQINQEKPPQSVEETRRRLEYDLYYIKNRSFSLDVRIALRTLKTLVMRAGL